MSTVKFTLVCPRHACRGGTFLGSVITDNKGRFVAFDALDYDGDRPTFYCTGCGSEAIAYKPGGGRTIGDQMDLPQQPDKQRMAEIKREQIKNRRLAEKTRKTAGAKLGG